MGAGNAQRAGVAAWPEGDPPGRQDSAGPSLAGGKFLRRKDWFGSNRLWQVVAMGKMAWTASDFFWDIMNQYFAWQPLADQLPCGA